MRTRTKTRWLGLILISFWKTKVFKGIKRCLELLSLFTLRLFSISCMRRNLTLKLVKNTTEVLTIAQMLVHLNDVDILTIKHLVFAEWLNDLSATYFFLQLWYYNTDSSILTIKLVLNFSRLLGPVPLQVWTGVGWTTDRFYVRILLAGLESSRRFHFARSLANYSQNGG